MTDESNSDKKKTIRNEPSSGRGWTAPEPDGEVREAFEAHLEKYLNGESKVWHEFISHLIHLDVYSYAPTPERPYYTLITSGMSDLPMTTPPGWEDASRAELMLCLPAHWTLEQGNIQDENLFWPLNVLKYLARFPHEHQTWLGWGHTISNGYPAEPVADTSFMGFIVGPVVTLPDEFPHLEIGEKSVWIYGIYPLYAEEFQFKLESSEGSDALFEKLENHGISEIVDVKRPNVMNILGELS